MAKPATKPATAATKPATAARMKRPAKPGTTGKKPVAYMNWIVCDATGEPILDENGNPILKSSRGLSIFDNEYTTDANRDLIELATVNGGTAKIHAQLTIVLAKDKTASTDLTKIPTIKRK